MSDTDQKIDDMDEITKAEEEIDEDGDKEPDSTLGEDSDIDDDADSEPDSELED